jgi:NADH-quinone oxidoreductase subunit J
MSQYLPSILFWLIASLTGLCAIATVVTQNIVRSATWLLFTLAGTSGIFFLLGADFIGGIQLLIYVGGTLILVVFGVMLTAQGPFISMKTSGAEWAISIAAGILLFAVLCFGISSRYGVMLPQHDSLAEKHGPAPSDSKPQDPSDSRTSSTLGQALLGAPYGPVYAETAAKAPLGTHYLLPFEIVSVHLLVVLIGAAYLARAKRPRGEQS